MYRAGANFFSTAIFALLLSGCATQAQRQAQVISQNWQATGSQLQACTLNIYNAPESKLIRRHMPYNAMNATLEQLTDSAKATDEEIKAIYMQHPKLQACRNSALQSLSTTTPTLVPILVDEYQKGDQITIDLVQRKITWGDANQRRKEIGADAQRQLTEAAQQIESSLQQSNAAELAQRQAAADALMRYSQTQQMINALNRPVTTTCTSGGNMVNCTSY